MCYSYDNIFAVVVWSYSFGVRSGFRTPNVLQRMIFGKVRQVTVSNDKQLYEKHHSSKPHTYVVCRQQYVTLNNNKYLYLYWS